MAQNKNIFKKNPSFENCPSCKNYNTLYRSHSRNILDFIIKNLTPYRKYRCVHCGWRGYLSTFKFSKSALKGILLYSLLTFIIVIVVREILNLVGH